MLQCRLCFLLNRQAVSDGQIKSYEFDTARPVMARARHEPSAGFLADRLDNHNFVTPSPKAGCEASNVYLTASVAVIKRALDDHAYPAFLRIHGRTTVEESAGFRAVRATCSLHTGMNTLDLLRYRAVFRFE